MRYTDRCLTFGEKFMRRTVSFIISTVCIASFIGCKSATFPLVASEAREASASDAQAPLLNTLAAEDWADVRAKFVDRAGATSGQIVVKNAPEGILMRVDLKGLSQGWHGIHLHQIGDCSDTQAGFKASGGHVDPANAAHGLLNPEGYELADIPNIYANADGRATAELYRGALSLQSTDDSRTALLDADGFAVVVHENADDHFTQPIGGAGGRVACAALGN